MSPGATTLALIDAASAPYWSTDFYAYFRARAKLGTDPAFGELLKSGLLLGTQRLLDLGCGQGLLAAWLSAARVRSEERPGEWPTGWAEAPRPSSIRGIDRHASDLRRARDAWGHKAQFELGDITEADFGSPDAVIMLDVLHYIEYEIQLNVLSRVRAALGASGVLLLRVGDASAGIRFAIGKCVDRTLMLTQYHRAPRVFCRSAQEWSEVLRNCGFGCEALPMSAGTPFANILLVARPRKIQRSIQPITEPLIAQ